jgi:capsule polysaccharide export protein KpsE/RkpR
LTGVTPCLPIGDKNTSPVLERQRNSTQSTKSLSQRATSDSELLDRVSVLEAEKAALPPQPQSPPSAPPTTTRASRPPIPDSSDPSGGDTPIVARLRLELAEALRSKGQFQQRLQVADAELARLRTKTAADSKTLRNLTAERRTLTVKLRDREEELRVKNKLVADVQDELAVLNMQLDMVERKRAEKEAENKQLVERFMKRVGQEAEAMNLANEPLFNRKR